MIRIAATAIAVLVLTQTGPVHAGPSAFDDAPRLVESIRVLPADGAQAVSMPTRVSAQAVTSQTMQVTGSLRVTMNGFDPLVFPANGPASVLLARDMPGSLPRSFTLGAGVFAGTKTVPPTVTGGLVEGLVMNASLGTVLASAGGGAGAGVGGIGPLTGTGDISVLNGYLHLWFPLSNIGQGGTQTFNGCSAGPCTIVGQMKADPGWTTGAVATSAPTSSGVVSAFATGSRGPNSLSLVTAFMYSSNATGPIPGVARLNLNFQPPGTTTTTTTLPPPLCGGAPLGGCKGSLAGKSQLQIKLKASDSSKNQLKFKYNKGALTLDTEFGDPVAGSPNFSLCIWDDGVAPQPLLEARVGSGGQCGKKPCWKSKPGKNHQYKNKGGNGDGVEQIKIKADGSPDKTQIQVKLKGTSFAAPALPLTTTVTAQFIVDDGGISCWEVPLSTAKKNDAVQFKAKGD